MTDPQVIEYYQTRLAEQQASVERCASRWNGMGYLRGGSFLVSLVPLILALNSVWGITTGWLILAGLLFLAFLFIAYLHEGMQSELQRASLLSAMHRESLARCERKWSEIRVPEIEVPKRFLPISTDLDLLGENSVYKLLGVTRTPLGTETLRSWIIEGARPVEIKLRQEAVAELRNEFDWRLKFRLLCETLASGQSGPSRFVQWSESQNWFAGFIWSYFNTVNTTTGAVTELGFGGSRKYSLFVIKEDELGVEARRIWNLFQCTHNPATTTINIKSLQTLALKKCILYDVLGRDTGAVPLNNEINIENLAKGMYILQLETENGTHNKKDNKGVVLGL